MRTSFKLIGFLILSFFALNLQSTFGQCNNTSQFGTITAPTTNTPTTITTCAFAGEYSTINSAVSGRTYQFNATGGTGNFLTVRQGTPGGTVLGFGNAPITVTCTVSGPLYLHYNTNSSCGTDGTCHTGTVTCTSCSGSPDPCLSISNLTCGVSATSILTGAGLWNVSSCGFSTPGSERVYSFTAAASGLHTLQVTSATGGFVDYFFKAASGGCSSTGWTCIDDIFSASSVTFGPLTAGVTYYLLLDPETTSTTTHTFQINCPAAGPANDQCANATPIACGSTATGSTSSAANDGPSADCLGGSTAADVWYTITGTGGAITASLCGGGTNYDSQLDVYTGACGSLTNIGGCNDDFCGTQSQMTWNSVLGMVYRIRVHGFAGSTGNFSLAVTCAPLCSLTTSISVTESSGTSNDGTVCSGSTVTLTASNGTSYVWSTGATTASISLNPTTTSTYTVTATDALACTATASQIITVLDNPNIVPTSTQPTTCISTDGSISLGVTGGSTPYTFAWTTPNGTPLSNPGAQNQSNLGVGTYNVVVTSQNGCSSSASINLIGPGNCGTCPVVGSLAVTGAAPNCVGNSKTLTASGLASMNPTYGIRFVQFTAATTDPYNGGTTLATIANGSLTSSGTVATANVLFPTAGTFFIYAILSPTPPNIACRPSATTTLTINSLPVVSINTTDVSGTTNNDGIICQGASATLTSAITGTYAWSNAATTQAITVTTAGNYVLTVTATTGCSATSSRTIVVNPLPTLFNVTGTGTICVVATGTPVGLSGSQTGVTYQLQRNSTNVGSPLSGTGSALTFPNQTVVGTYTVIATNTSTGCTSTMTGSAVLSLDTQAPGIICPANVTANVAPGLCSAVVTYTAPVGTDNCPNPTTVQIAGLISGATYPVGVTTNAFRVTDINGFTATCSFNVTVVDNIAPAITCPANITMNVEVATCNKLVTYTPPVGTDNCPNPVTTQVSGFPSGTTVGPGVYTNVYRVTDAVGNSTTCSFTVTILGSVPTITCPTLVVVNNSPGLCGAFVSFAATVPGNLFPPATITYSIPPGSFFQPGYTQVTATATNSCGSASCTFGVIVNIGADPELAASYTVIANNYVGMVKNTVKSGGVGITNPNGTVQLQSNTDVTSSLSFVKSPFLLASGGSVVNTYYNGTVSSNIVPPFLFTTPQTYNSVVIPDNTTKILDLASYGDILVGNNATAIFTGQSQVKIKQLKTMSGSRLQFSQNTNVPIKSFMEIGPRGSVNAGSTSLVTLYVEGNATIKSSSRINANIHTLRLLVVESSPSTAPTNMTGLFIGHQVNAEDNVIWNRNALNCQLNIGNKPAINDEDNDEQSNLVLENRSKRNFVVYPNPAVDYIRVDYDIKDISLATSFGLYDINGRKIYDKVVESIGDNTLFIEVGELEAGMYQISMEIEGKIIQSQRIAIIK